MEDDPLSRAPELLPKHTIFLSHSGEVKPFVEQLSKDLEEAKLYPFFDQDRGSLPIGEKFGPLIMEAAKQCLVAVVVLSPEYLESPWPMKELIAFYESYKSKGSLVKFVPLFYKLDVEDIPREEAQSKEDLHQIGGRKQSIAKPGNAKRTLDEWMKVWKAIREVRDGKVVIDEKLCFEALKALKSVNGLRFSKFGKSEVRFRKHAVEVISRLAPPAIPFDTSEILGYDRLCKEIAGMFVDGIKQPGVQYLGLHGHEGSGKSTLSCEAMCAYFQKTFQGRFCRVELDFDTDSEASKQKKEARLRQAIQNLFGLDKPMQSINAAPQLKTHLQSKLDATPVFLVVDNVSQSSREEAEYYVSTLKFATGSKVLVTSRSSIILKSLLEGEQYCRPVPWLEKKEALELILKKAAQSKLDILNPEAGESEEKAIVEDCVAEASVGGEQYNPLTLKMLATALRDSGDILNWKPTIESLRNSGSSGKDIYRLHLMQYDKLDKTSKLVFLDLTIFADGLYLAHEDLHCGVLPSGEGNSYIHAITYISLLHGVTFRQASQMVTALKGTPFVHFSETKIPSESRIKVPQSYVYFARWLIQRNGSREEKDWCMVCKPEVKDDNFDEGDSHPAEIGDKVQRSEHIPKIDFADLTPVSNPSNLVRVSISKLALAYSDHLQIRQWRFVSCLELIQVSYLQCLNLQGLHSLRVLRVEECVNLESITCTCENVSPTDNRFCYESTNMGCMPNLHFVQLAYLTTLKWASFPSHAWNLAVLWFLDCPNMVRLPDLRFCKHLKKLRLPCGDFEGFQGLGTNKALTELAFQWNPETVRNFTEEMKETLLEEIMSLEELQVLDIVDERQVYEWIPAAFRTFKVTKLAHLTFLDLSYATTIEEVVGLEHLAGTLTSLGLYGCIELRKLPGLVRCKKLRRLCIGHCHKLEFAQDDFDWDIQNFHHFGESCSFGEHECLEPDDNWFGGICKVCPPKKEAGDPVDVEEKFEEQKAGDKAEEGGEGMAKSADQEGDELAEAGEREGDKTEGVGEEGKAEEDDEERERTMPAVAEEDLGQEGEEEGSMAQEKEAGDAVDVEEKFEEQKAGDKTEEGEEGMDKSADQEGDELAEAGEREGDKTEGEGEEGKAEEDGQEGEEEGSMAQEE